MNLTIQEKAVSAINIKRGQTLTFAGGIGPVWRVTQGVFKLERQGQDGQILVQLAQAGDLIGVESLCAEPYAFTAVALVAAQAKPLAAGQDLDLDGKQPPHRRPGALHAREGNWPAYRLHHAHDA